MVNITLLTSVLAPLIAAVFASSGLWSFLLYLAQKRDQKKDIHTNAELALLHDAVYNSCQKAIHRGYTTVMELENIEALYKVYNEMGGNGTGTQLYERVTKLPIKAHTEEEVTEEIRNDNEGNDTIS